MAACKTQIDAAAGYRLETLAREYNGLRRDALKTRNNLMVQREALGFRVGNVEAVLSQYDIPPPLDVRGRELSPEERGRGQVPLPPETGRGPGTGTRATDHARRRTPTRPPRRY